MLVARTLVGVTLAKPRVILVAVGEHGRSFSKLAHG
jgi:hypothetical protein